MSSIKAPATLRACRTTPIRESRPTGVAAACLLALSSSGGAAQVAPPRADAAGTTEQSTPAQMPVQPGAAPQPVAPAAVAPSPSASTPSPASSATAPAAGAAATSTSAPAPASTSAPMPAAMPTPAPATAGAPSGAAEQLPALTVEAKKRSERSRPAAAAPPAAVKAAPAPAEAAPAPAAAQSASSAEPAGGTATPAAANANPYADPNAPYKVDRSSSNKLTEPLLDTAKTVTNVSKEVMQDKGATSVRELARTTPGVTLGTGEGGNPFGDRLFIRGFDARNDAYINGVRDSGVPIRENFNTEQIEILKGPSATVGGRGTTGGAVNIVTKQAAERDFTVVTTTLGTDATKRSTLDYNKVLSDQWSIRVNGMWQDADVAGRDEVYDNRWGGALAIMWKPTSWLKVSADYYHLSLDQLPDWGVPWDSVNHRPFTDSGVSRNAYYGYPARDFQKGQQDVLTATGEAKLGDGLTLSNRFRYGVSVIDYIAAAPEAVSRASSDPSKWTVQSRPKSRYQQNEVVADQLDLTAKVETFGVRHTIVTGAEISRETITRDSYSGLASEAFNPGAGVPSGTIVANLWSPNTGSIGFSGSPTRAGLPAVVTVDTQSAYILDTMKLTDQWIVTGGLRLDSYGLSLDQANANAPRTLLSRDDLILSYSTGLTYKPLPNGSIYAAYGTSSNPVGQELDGIGQAYGGLSSGNALLDPERNRSVELGTKWELLGRRILATAAVFETHKENARETRTGDPNVYSTGTYRVRGVEFGLSGNLTSALSVFGGLVLMDSKVLESINPGDVGRPFANIAHESFNLLAKYKLTDWFSVGGQATYRGKIRGGTIAANNNTIDDFWRFDALAEVKLDEHFTLQIQGLNLTDQVYYDALYRSASPFTYIAPGRVGYVTLQYKY